MNIFTSKTHVDLEFPIYMTDIQSEKFIHFMEKMFPEISVVQVEEITKKQTGRPKGDKKKWTVDDYFALLGSEGNKELAVKLERSEMSIKMKIGKFIPDFLNWMNSKGYIVPFSKKMIKEYFYERGEY